MDQPAAHADSIIIQIIPKYTRVADAVRRDHMRNKLSPAAVIRTLSRKTRVIPIRVITRRRAYARYRLAPFFNRR